MRPVLQLGVLNTYLCRRNGGQGSVGSATGVLGQHRSPSQSVLSLSVDKHRDHKVNIGSAQSAVGVGTYVLPLALHAGSGSRSRVPEQQRALRARCSSSRTNPWPEPPWPRPTQSNSVVCRENRAPRGRNVGDGWWVSKMSQGSGGTRPICGRRLHAETISFVSLVRDKARFAALAPPVVSRYNHRAMLRSSSAKS